MSVKVNGGSLVMLLVAALFAITALGGKCSGKGDGRSQDPGLAGTDTVPDASEAAPEQGDAKPVRDALEGGPLPSLLVVQSQFVKKEGKSVPGPARLDIVRRAGDGFESVVIEDPDSNVFHKAMACTAPDGRKGILTIGAMKAMLKFWWWADGRWNAETLWEVSFGGKTDRLRDMEMGDVDGDGKDEIVVATHDQGVVAVVSWDTSGPVVAKVDATADTFVHEIEVGDVDGDGKKEFFATPSEPNKVGQSQNGQVVRFSFDGEKFVKSVVESYEGRHVKEILAADLDGDGKATLFAVVEAQLSKMAGVTRIEKPVEIRQFDFSGPAPESSVIGSIEDSQCRFLAWGDADGDGKNEIVAAAMKTGLWLMRPTGNGQWSAVNFETLSSGYEHAAIFADLDGDPGQEIYVAADDQKRLDAYRWADGKLVRSLVIDLPDGVITWNIVPASI